MKIQQVLNSALPSWYPVFKAVTIKSHLLDIPEDVFEYLCSDGTLVLPEGSMGSLINEPSDDDDDDNRNKVDWDKCSSEEAKCPSFPEFESDIKRAISRLGGAVFPKLNWSSPKDATWISCNNTLKCTSSADVYLLLKSSEFVTHDLTQPFVDCDDYDETKRPEVKYKLVLRRWHDLNPGGEFRCFVKNNKLIGMCQRHHTSFYPFVKSQKEEIQTDIIQFFNKNLKNRYADIDYVFDVYRKEKDKVYLVDFNPFGETTDSLMFTWDELTGNHSPKGTGHQEENNGPAFRVVENAGGVQPSPYRMYGMPLDFVDLSTGSDPLKLVDFLQLKIQKDNEDPSSDEDEPTSNQQAAR